MNAKQIKDIKNHLEKRLANAMEWYAGCISCSETFDNIRQDVKSILKEVSEKYQINELPFTIRLDVEDNGRVIVLRAIDKKSN